jgi:hypothetical protein
MYVLCYFIASYHSPVAIFCADELCVCRVSFGTLIFYSLLIPSWQELLFFILDDIIQHCLPILDVCMCMCSSIEFRCQIETARYGSIMRLLELGDPDQVSKAK